MVPHLAYISTREVTTGRLRGSFYSVISLCIFLTWLRAPRWRRCRECSPSSPHLAWHGWLSFYQSTLAPSLTRQSTCSGRHLSVAFARTSGDQFPFPTLGVPIQHRVPGDSLQVGHFLEHFPGEANGSAGREHVEERGDPRACSLQKREAPDVVVERDGAIRVWAFGEARMRVLGQGSSGRSCSSERRRHLVRRRRGAWRRGSCRGEDRRPRCGRGSALAFAWICSGRESSPGVPLERRMPWQ